MKIIEYIIVGSKSEDYLSSLVNLKIKDGWQPFGDLSAQTYEDGEPMFWYNQPMVKYEEIK